MASPGKIDQMVTIQTYQTTSDGAGGTIVTWEDLASVWAAVASEAGRESIEEGRTNAASGVVFTIRNRSDVNATMRIIWEGVAHNIRQVKSTGSRSMYLKIIAERGVAS